jgi:hypothetical protein
VPRKIILRWDDPQFELSHRIKNMGEDLWGDLRNGGIGSTDIAEIDAAKDHFTVLVTSRMLGPATELIRSKLKKHNLSDVVKIERG